MKVSFSPKVHTYPVAYVPVILEWLLHIHIEAHRLTCMYFHLLLFSC